LPILAWVTLFHVVDAAQTLAAFVLRAYRIATAPMFIFAARCGAWGWAAAIVLAFDTLGLTPPALRGAPGYWAASTAGLTLAVPCCWRWCGRSCASRRRPDRASGQREAAAAAVARLAAHVPPWRSAIWRTSARPRPTPPAFSAWPGRRKKGSKMRSR
jgi:hypothetical protein